MSYKVVQKIRGKYYLYLVTDAEWDPKKKNSKQTRVYLGPCDKDGKLDESRRKKAKQPKPQEEVLYWSKNLGQYHLLNELANNSGLSKALTNAFGEAMGKNILALAMLRIAQPTSLRNTEDTMRSTYIKELLDIDTDFSSQRMSEIVKSIGNDEDARKKYCSEAVKDSGVIIFDTTVLFSSSRLFDMLEYGRKYKQSGLPQVNMGYVHSLDRGMPVFYKLYPGSISDNVTVVNLIKELKGMGSTSQHLVMDRGFYSENNFRAMYLEGYGFTVPIPSGRKLFKSVLTQALDDLENPVNMFRFHGRTEFYADLEITMPFEGIVGPDGKVVPTIRVLVFQNNDRRKDEIDTLAERIDSVEHDALSLEYNKENLYRLFDGHNSDLRQLFDIQQKGGVIELIRKRNAISFAMRKCGRLVLITTCKDTPKAVLEQYHLRDWVEKDYEMLKDDMDGGLEYVRDSTSAEGVMFIQFIATGLRMYLNSKVSENEGLKKLGIPQILKKLNLVTISKIDKKLMISEIGKAQRTIFESFGVNSPSL